MRTNDRKTLTRMDNLEARMFVASDVQAFHFHTARVVQIEANEEGSKKDEDPDGEKKIRCGKQ